MKKTFFAKAEKSTSAEINEQIKLIAENRLIDQLMTTISGMFAVLNENRQIIALNQAFLETLGIESVEGVLGCRPGDAIQCVNATAYPNGCGTTRKCRTCGAVVAIVSSLELGKPVDNICVAEVKKDGQISNLFLGVRAAPIYLADHPFILLFLQDLSAQQQVGALEKVFFHDINNILSSMLGNVEMLELQCSGKALEVATSIKDNTIKLCREVELQKLISHGNAEGFQCYKEKISVNTILEETCNSLKHHRFLQHKTLSIRRLHPDQTIRSDRYLIVKILTNMLLNALEASEDGDEVRIWARPSKSSDMEKIVFSVWNNAIIPDDVLQRVFQKNFSTRGTRGRGLGTYSMKLFGEALLHGEISCSSCESEGTTFRFTI